MRIVRARLFDFRIQLRDPVQTSQGVVDKRDGTLVALEDESGHVGWGEATPYPGFGLESHAEARACLTRLIDEVVARGRFERLEATDAAAPPTSFAPVAHSAFETALDDLSARETGRSIAALLAETLPSGGPPARSVPVNALLVGADPESLSAAGLKARDQGYGSFKVKVGALSLEADVARVAALRESLGAASRIRLDANRAWDFDDAREAIRQLAAFDIEYLEELLAAAENSGLAQLRKSSAIALAADESAASESATRAVLDAGAADWIIVKPSAVGGVRSAARIARVARDRGVEVVVTSLLDAAIGRTAALHVAAWWGGGEPGLRACGLATGHLLGEDLAHTAEPSEGRLALPSGIGLGIAPDSSWLHECVAERWVS